MTDKDQMPPLPERTLFHGAPAAAFTSDQMHAYAAQAVQAALSSQAPAEPGHIERKVYKDSAEHREYLSARFDQKHRTGISFEWDGHRWAYRHTSFDDAGEYDLLWRPADALQSRQPAAPAAPVAPVAAVPDADTVQVYGVKDGQETLLGTVPMPARMKARELANEQFGHFEDDDGSDAELCFGAMEQLLEFIERTASPTPPVQPALTVRLTSFPESNGKRNWTAMFVRRERWDGLIGNAGGITIDRGECWNRIAYAAERARCLLGERQSEPDIMAYGVDVKTPAEWTGCDPEGLDAAQAEGGK